MGEGLKNKIIVIDGDVGPGQDISIGTNWINGVKKTNVLPEGAQVLDADSQEAQDFASDLQAKLRAKFTQVGAGSTPSTNQGDRIEGANVESNIIRGNGLRVDATKKPATSTPSGTEYVAPFKIGSTIIDGRFNNDVLDGTWDYQYRGGQHVYIKR
jgi:hypothetical protein